MAISEITLPQGFTIRTATLNDAELIFGLVRELDIELYGRSETPIEVVRIWLQEPGFDITRDSQLVFSPEGRLIAWAAIFHREHVHIYPEGAVLAAYRRQGIGTQLLRWAEQSGLQHLAQAPADARVIFAVGANNQAIEALQLFERHGYKLVRHFWHMGIMMQEAPPAPQWAEGITMHTMAPGMEYAVWQADEEAFRDHWGHMDGTFEEWAHWTIKREGHDPSLWFLAMDGDQIAGFALCRYLKETDEGSVENLGVLRPWRREGLGLALLHQAFGEFYRRGVQHISLGVDAQSLTGATRLYERAGMHVERQSNRYEKEIRAGKELSTQSVDV